MIIIVIIIVIMTIVIIIVIIIVVVIMITIRTIVVTQYSSPGPIVNLQSSFASTCHVLALCYDISVISGACASCVHGVVT